MNDLFCMDDLRDEILTVGSYASSDAMDALGPEWLCKFKGVIIMALKIAMLFVGRREKEILKAVIEGIEKMCDQ